ncbi:MAG: cation transporter [Bacteroidetes bacterium]|nr:MAG: cation transporter [Bacteroidota bacterium]
MGKHHEHASSSNNLKIAFFLNLAFTIIEIVGGFFVNSIAIISDAFHDLGDSFSLGMAWYLDIRAKKHPDKSFSYGYYRLSLLGALINSLVLISGSTYVIYEAIGRFFDPQYSNANGMILFAILGIAVNGFAAWKLRGGKSLNEQVISWHLLEDVLGWVAVLIVASILHFWNTPYLDPALSLAITLYILWGVFGRLKETLFIFLQGVPKEIDLKALEQELLEIPNVQSIHETRAWSLDGERHIITTHLKLGPIQSPQQITEVKEAARKILKHYHFSDFTIETELIDESHHPGLADSQ